FLAGTMLCAQAQTPYVWELPPDVDPPALPEGAVMTQELVEFGRHLFYDKRLSGNGTQACASCHIQELAFTDGRAVGLGSTGELHPRSPMSLVNVAYRDSLTWADKDLQLLEDQALAPMFGEHPVELGMSGHEDNLYARLAADPVYAALFGAAYPEREFTLDRRTVIDALVAFERSIVSFASPYDRFRFYGEQSALDASAQRGVDLFFSKQANCSACHLGQNTTIDLGLNMDGASRTSNSDPHEPHFFLFRNTGLYALGDPFSYPMDNLGLYEHTGYEKDIGRFRTPTLRNVALTAPYMHDGSIATLDEVLDHYVAGGRAKNPQLTEFLVPLELSAQDRTDLLAFLHSLTDQNVVSAPQWSNPWPARRAQEASAIPPHIAQAVAAPERPAVDRERDPASKPAEVLAFMGIEPGQAVLDFQAAGGYFTEVLARAVGTKGHVIAHYHEPDRSLNPEAFALRYGTGERLPNVERIFAKHNDLDLPSASLDAVLMSMVYHDTYWLGDDVDWGPVDQQALLAELYDSLKPGGVVLVIDHQAEPGADPYESAVATHRIDRAVVLRDFTAAGFVFREESALLGNPDDAPDVQIFEDAVYRKTDRFMLLFGKPQ
ncbi:MAG TPA: di-heme enzyme, partial [Hyphomicrobiales bacterium]|nr:di-heme enzyme [Hyphomicrobiales bacterium]